MKKCALTISRWQEQPEGRTADNACQSGIDMVITHRIGKGGGKGGGVHRTRCEDVNSNPRATKIQNQRTEHAPKSSLRPAVEAHPLGALDRGRRTYDHDAATTIRHACDRWLHGEQHAFHIGVEDVVELRLRDSS